MPDPADPKVHAHPLRRAPSAPPFPPRGPAHAPPAVAYAELAVTSNFTFLTGASHPDEFVAQAAALGYRALALADHNTLAGIVRAHVAAKDAGIPFIVGCRLRFVAPANLSLFVYPTDRAAYGRLCRLLTIGKRRAPKGECHLWLDDLPDHVHGLLAIAWFESPTDPDVPGIVTLLRGLFDDDRLSLALARLYTPHDPRCLEAAVELARLTGLPLVAVNDAHYHVPQRKALHDVLTCVRHGCKLDEAGLRLFANAERHLKPPDEMARLFAEHPRAVARTVEIARRAAGFSLNQLRYEYPHEICPPGRTPMEHLRDLTGRGAAERYPRDVPDKVRRQIEHEFSLIEALDYAPYFLTVHDLVRFARARGILCQGRGAAANSAVCYCLGVTSVDPDRIDVLFERFVSRERNEPPDIDIDFEHERREEVIQYLYGKYGRDRAGLTAEVITYRGRSAVRDVGKALGLSLDAVDRLARRVNDWFDEGLTPESLAALGLDPADTTVRLLVRLVGEIAGFPRHLSQHVGGFVISRGPLCELVPIENAAMENRTVIEWDKDDIEALGMLKVDVLGLGMLTCLAKCFVLLENREQGAGGNDQGREDRRRGRGETAPIRKQFDGEREGLSRPHRVAEGGRPHQGCLSDHAGAPGFGAIRPDITDAPGGSFDTEQHCRGKCPSEREGLPGVPDDGPRLPGRTRDAGDRCGRVETVDRSGSDFVGDRRSKATSPGPYSESASSPLSPEVTPAGAPSVPCSLLPVPSSLATIPAEDPAVYDMICRADTVGVFQIESRAQMTMLPRLRPRCFYDLVIEVAIVRPGPIVGDMVHPYLRRRNGQEPVVYPDEKIEKVLGKTLGIPLFQEQAMALAIVAAGFTPGEAEMLRRTISAWKSRGKDAIPRYQHRFIEGMVRNGYDRAFADQCFQRLKGFSEYGFPESHSASFALLVYASAWLKCYYPAAFAAALLNSQPMGFYAPAQIIRDAVDHGVEVRPVDVNRSDWDCSLESGGRAIRLGMRMVAGLREAHARAIAQAVRDRGPFRSLLDLWRASEAPPSALHVLAQADAFGSMGLDRQQALWTVRSIRGRPLPLFDAPGREPESHDRPTTLPAPSAPREVLRDYQSVGLSLKAHPLSFLRPALEKRRVLTAAEIRDEKRCPHGRFAAVAGIVLFRQRPATARGVMFMTLEDETGRADLIVRPRVYQRFRSPALHGQIVLAHGRVERDDRVVHLLASRLEDLAFQPGDWPNLSRDFH